MNAGVGEMIGILEKSNRGVLGQDDVPHVVSIQDGIFY